MKALAALTAGKMLPPVSRPTPVPIPSARCDVLFEIFSNSLGSVSLGRMLKGPDAGRLVALRKLPGAPSSELLSAADLGRSIAHPKLAKVLGVIRGSEASYVASEYISGATVFELGRVVVGRNASVDARVAVRIILDALQAAHAARQLLDTTMGLRSVRCLFAECIWVADFGETFLSEVVVAPLLAPAEGSTGSPNGTDAEAMDVRCAALELVRLASGGLSTEDPLSCDLSGLPDELQESLASVIGHRLGSSQCSIEGFIALLRGLDPSLIATEDQVSTELRRFMATVLNVRQQKLDMLERSSAQDDDEDRADETKFFRASMKTEERDTTRPPPSCKDELVAQGESALAKRTALIAANVSAPLHSLAPREVPVRALNTPVIVNSSAAPRIGSRPEDLQSQPADDRTLIWRNPASISPGSARPRPGLVTLPEDDTASSVKTRLDSFVRSRRPTVDSASESPAVSSSGASLRATRRSQRAAAHSTRLLFALVSVLALVAVARALWLMKHGYSLTAAGAGHWDWPSSLRSARALWR